MRGLPCKSIPGQMTLLLLLSLLLSEGGAAVQTSAQKVSYRTGSCCWTKSCDSQERKRAAAELEHFLLSGNQ